MKSKYKILTDPDNHKLNNNAGEYYYVEDLIAQTPDGLIRVRGKYAATKIKFIGGIWIIDNDHSIEQKPDIVNGSSIPWFGQWLISKEGKWNRSSGFHDKGYKYAKIEFFVNGRWIYYKKSRKWFDQLYRSLMESRGVEEWNSTTQYEMLRSCGWWTWWNYRRHDE